MKLGHCHHAVAGYYHGISRGSLEGCKSIVNVKRYSGIMTSHIWIWLLRCIFARLHPKLCFFLLFRILPFIFFNIITSESQKKNNVNKNKDGRYRYAEHGCHD